MKKKHIMRVLTIRPGDLLEMKRFLDETWGTPKYQQESKTERYNYGTVILNVQTYSDETTPPRAQLTIGNGIDQATLRRLEGMVKK